MTSTIDVLPITDTVEAVDQEAVATAVQQAYAEETPVYPIGGGTSLDFGMPAKQPGLGLMLTGLDNVIDYPASDMTITVEAGITMEKISSVLAENNQQLPLDVPFESQATLGGVVATNTNGPRRYGLGTVRDYVLGISAVDGCGIPFKGGGRIVKNVAGYDFCKMMTGSLGTLGVLTQITMRVRPIPPASRLVAGIVDVDDAEPLLAKMMSSQASLAALELLTGDEWKKDDAVGALASKMGSQGALVVVGVEGTEPEVEWMHPQVTRELRDGGATNVRTLAQKASDGFWKQLVEFPAIGESPLVVKATMVSSQVTKFLAACEQLETDCSCLAHAGNGVVYVRFAEFPKEGISGSIVSKLLPTAAAGHGNVVILSNPGGKEMTLQSVWGGINAPFALMTEVKNKFDPKNILNPDRFVYR